MNEIKHAWVERIGAECVAVDVPFFLEFVGYEEGGDEKGIASRARSRKSSRNSMDGIFQAAIRRGCLKVEVPVNMAYVAGSEGLQGRRGLHARSGQGFFSGAPRGGEEAVYLSFGGREQRCVSRDAGAGGRSRHEFLGRAVRARHLEGRHPRLRESKGVKALEDWLNDQGVKNIENVKRAPEGGQALVCLLRRSRTAASRWAGGK
jgi:tagatose 1,6-diphosphate aldolase